MFPLPPDFTRSDPNESFEAWWLYAPPAGLSQVCATSAASLIAAVRMRVGLPPSGGWDNALLRALSGRVESLSGRGGDWSGLQTAVGMDARAPAGQSLHRETLIFAIWLAFYESSGRRLDAISLPEGVVLPRVGLDVQGPSQQLACWESGATPAQQMSATQLAALRRATALALAQPAPTDSPPVYDIGISPIAVAGIVIGIGLFAYLVAGRNA